MTNDEGERRTEPFPLHVEASGAGAPVLLLHSSGLSGRQWRRLVPSVVKLGCRAVVPDFTGHGASTAWPEPKPLTIQTDVAHVTTLLEEQGPAHLVGHSYGGLVALLAARARPTSVRSLVLFEPVAFGTLDRAKDNDALAELSRVDVRWGTSADEHEAWLRRFVDFWGGDGAWAALRPDVQGEFRRVGWAVHEGVRTLMEDTTPGSAYGVVRAPVQLMTGATSPLPARRVVERLRGALPDARVSIVPNAGHMAPLSHGDVVNAIVLDALTRAVREASPST